MARPLTYRWKLYESGKLLLVDRTMDWYADDIRMILCDSTSNCEDLTLTALASITGQLATAYGYTQDTKAVASRSIVPNGTNIEKWGMGDCIWTISGGSIAPRFGVLYNATIGGNPLIAVQKIDDNDVVTLTGNTFRYMSANPNGFVTLSGADVD
jgi:hypothetical protein